MGVLLLAHVQGAKRGKDLTSTNVASSRKLFLWHSFDVTSELPESWELCLQRIARAHAVQKSLAPTSVTSRESASITDIPVTTVGGVALAREAPWLDTLYKNRFRELAELVYGVEVSCAQDPRIGINLNVQCGATQRYEAHVDSNPIEGLLYVTTNPPGSGGELVVANNPAAVGIEEIEHDQSRVYPVSGQLIFFDARQHPHYVRPLVASDGERLVVAMNFYTAECTEADRPRDLNLHLFNEA